MSTWAYASTWFGRTSEIGKLMSVLQRDDWLDLQSPGGLGINDEVGSHRRVSNTGREEVTVRSV